MSDPYEEYFASTRDTYGLVRVKRNWVPEWLWQLACLPSPHWALALLPGVSQLLTRVP